MSLNSRHFAVFVALLSLNYTGSVFADGYVATPHTTVTETEILPQNEAARISFPEKNRSYEEMVAKKELAHDQENLEKILPSDSSTKMEVSIASAAIVSAEPFSASTDGTESQSLYAPKPSLLDGSADHLAESNESSPQKEIRALEAAQAESTQSTAKRPQSRATLTEKNLAPKAQASSSETLQKSVPFVPNLADLTIDNPQKKSNKISTPSKPNQVNPAYHDDMPQSYENQTDLATPSKPEKIAIPTSLPAVSPQAIKADPGYHSYTVTDPSEVEHINMDCVVSVDQDATTGAFVIRAKEDCK